MIHSLICELKTIILFNIIKGLHHNYNVWKQHVKMSSKKIQLGNLKNILLVKYLISESAS